MKAENVEQQFDDGLDALAREASKLGVTRQSVIKFWLAERLEASASSVQLLRSRAGSVRR